MSQFDNLNTIKFLKLAAICSLLGATTTALLIFLPRPEVNDFESQALLYQNSLYMTRLWILFVHPQVNTIAMLGVCFLLFRKYPLQISLGTLFMFVWFYSEMYQQALVIDAVNQTWRPAYLNSTDEVDKMINRTLIQGSAAFSDSLYFLVIYGFGFGSLLYGFAFIYEQTLAKWIGVSLIFIGVLSLASFLRYYLGLHFLNGIVDWIYTWVYPYLQPVVRIAIAIWILQRKDEFNSATKHPLPHLE